MLNLLIILEIKYFTFLGDDSFIFDDIVVKMTSILNQYFHSDGSIPV